MLDWIYWFSETLSLTYKYICRSVTYILWYCDSALYFQYYLINKPHSLDFDVNGNILSLRSFVAMFKKSLWSLILYNVFHDFIHVYIAPGQGQTTPSGQSFDVNKNVLSLHSFVASFKQMSLKSDFIQFFSCLYTFIAPEQGWPTLGDEILKSAETSCHFGHLLQV